METKKKNEIMIQNKKLKTFCKKLLNMSYVKAIIFQNGMAIKNIPSWSK